MFPLAFALALASPCDSIDACVVTCESGDLTACAAVVRAARSSEEVVKALPKLTPACDRGSIAACSAIMQAATISASGSDDAKKLAPVLASSAKKASSFYCATAKPPDDLWRVILGTCAWASSAFGKPRLTDSAFSRAAAECQTSTENVAACADILIPLSERHHAVKTPKEKALRKKQFVDAITRVIDACHAPRDDTCRALQIIYSIDDSALWHARDKKLCAVDGGMDGGKICERVARRECDDGAGPVATCVDAVLTSGGEAFDTPEVAEKLTNACLKDDARACFAAGIGAVDDRFPKVSADEAFARGCKLADAGSCRAAQRPVALPDPGTVPKNASRSDPDDASDDRRFVVRAPGDGAPLGRWVLLESWEWEGKDHVRHVRLVRRVDGSKEINELREGAELVEWKTEHDRRTRTVFVVNAAR